MELHKRVLKYRSLALNSHECHPRYCPHHRIEREARPGLLAWLRGRGCNVRHNGLIHPKFINVNYIILIYGIGTEV